MEIFSKAFTWLAELSAKLPKIDYKTYFIVVLAAIAVTGLIVALTLFGSNCHKVKSASKRIIKYLAEKDTVDDDNVSDFTEQCFSKKTPQSMRDAWYQFLGVHYGYPSEIISEQNVFDKEVKKHRDVRANVFICIALVLLAGFAFWGYGTLESHEMGVIHCLGLVLSAVLYIIIVVLQRKQQKRALEAFNTMQEDLDAKVNLKVERTYAVDASPLNKIATILDEIIARNTSKYIDEDAPSDENPDTIEQPIEEIPEEGLEELPAPLTEYVEEEQPAEQPQELEEQPAEELEEEVEEQPVEELEEQPAQEEQPQEEPQETAEEPAPEEAPEQEEIEEEAIVEETTEEQPEEELVDEEIVEEEQQEESEPEAEEPAEEEQEEISEEPAEPEAEELTEEEETFEQPEEAEEEPALEEEPEEAAEELEKQPEEELEEDVEPEESEEPEEGEEPEASEELEEAAEEPSEEDEVRDEAEEGEEPESEEEPEQEGEEEDEEQSDEEAEVIYHVDNVDEEEDVKPAKLAKLPNLIDYMLTMNLSRPMKINFAMMLLGKYNKYKDNPEEKAIMVQCIKKIITNLQNG